MLGIQPSATDDEVKEAYRVLVRKYHPDNYADDNPLKELANEKMQEINAAYDEIQRLRQNGYGQNNGSGYNNNSGYSNNSGYNNNNSGYNSGYSSPEYAAIRASINNQRFADAERQLNAIPGHERTAEWHYLKSIILMRKGNASDAMRELEIACNMDPSNVEYQQAKQMFNNNANAYGNMYYGQQGRRASSTDDACNCCANLICLDCLCECLGGDLIRCI